VFHPFDLAAILLIFDIYSLISKDVFQSAEETLPNCLQKDTKLAIMEAILVKPGREAILRNPNFPRSEKSLDLVQNSCVKLYHFWRLLMRTQFLKN